MSLLTETVSYWNNNPDLYSAGGKLYLGFVPDASAYPYCAVQQISNTPQWLTGGDTPEDAIIQFDVFSTSGAEVNSIVDIIKREFDWVKFTATVIYCERQNDYIIAEQNKVYHGIVEYRVCIQRERYN